MAFVIITNTENLENRTFGIFVTSIPVLPSCDVVYPLLDLAMPMFVLVKTYTGWAKLNGANLHFCL